MSFATSLNSRRWASAAVMALAAASAHAESTYPDQPLHWVIPWGPGSATDTLARVISQGLGQTYGEPVVVENRSGADGNIGASYAVRAKPDGYTVMLGTASTNAVNVLLQKDLRYDPQRDLRAVAMIGTIPNVLVVSKARKVTSLQQLLEEGRTKPLSFASTGMGGTVHLSGELFRNITGLDLLHVPYKDGASLLADLLTARVDMMFCNIPLCIKYLESGELVALGVTTKERSEALPDVPTLAEQGLKDFNVVGWYGIFAPKAVPDAIVARLSEAFNGAMDSAQVSERLRDMGVVRSAQTPAEVDAFAAQERERWGEVLRQAGLP